MRYIVDRRLTYEGTLLFGGLFFLFTAVGMLIYPIWFARTSIPTVATVVQLAEVRGIRDGRSQVQYAPVFSYIDKNGAPYIVQHGGSSRPALYSVGQKVTLHVSSDNPYNYILALPYDLWMWAGFAGLIGIGLIVNLVQEIRSDLGKK